MFGARVDIISLFYPVFGVTHDMITYTINFPFISQEPDKTISPLGPVWHVGLGDTI